MISRSTIFSLTSLENAAETNTIQAKIALTKTLIIPLTPPPKYFSHFFINTH